jgi:hypothetical protein
MKKLLASLAVTVLVLAIAPAALAVGGTKAKPASTTHKFALSGTLVSVDTTNSLVVVRTTGGKSQSTKAKSKKITVAVTDKTQILLREQTASGKLSKPRTLALADLKPGKRVNVRGTVLTQNGARQYTAARVVMLVRTYQFQCNATIASTPDPVASTFLVKLKTMSHNWNGWKNDKNIWGKEITITVTPATKIFSRQLDAAGNAGGPVAATLADLAVGNAVHISGRAVAADDGSNQFVAVRIVESLPAPATP